MSTENIFHLRPTGWENDPQEERFELSGLDYCVTCSWLPLALFFKLEDIDKPPVLETLKHGLERTLSQTRQLCGRLEQDPNGGFSFVKRRDSTVPFHVQHLDGLKDKGKYPGLDQLEKGYFNAAVLGEEKTWVIPGMEYGDKTECLPENNPKAAAFKANFIRGGMVFMMHSHHYANDIMGWAGMLHQLAENCNAIYNKTDFPPWNPTCLDRSIFRKLDVPVDQQMDWPDSPGRDPGHKDCDALLFHLPKSRLAELKKLASPEDGSYWISSYDGLVAFMLRHWSRLRAPLFKPDLSQPLLFAKGVNMRPRIPGIPLRTQGNALYALLSTVTPVAQLTAGEIISEAPLRNIAHYIRQATDSVTPESLNQTLDLLARVRDKTKLAMGVDSFPPMSNLVTEWRDTCVTEANFGFGRSHGFRVICGYALNGLCVVYPPRAQTGNLDEGYEIMFSWERELFDELVSDPEWNKYFEYRGMAL